MRWPRRAGFARLAGLVLLAGSLLGCAPGANGGFVIGGNGHGCIPRRIATVPVVYRAGLLFVTATVNGKPVRLVLDTGAQRTLLTEAAVRRLGLPSDLSHGTRTWGIGGPTSAFDARVRRFALAGVAFDMPLVTVGRFHLAPQQGGADGMFGADLLRLFDIDLDAAAGRMVLYRAGVCRMTAPPWNGPAVVLPGVRSASDRLMLPIAVNGVPGLATLDTGAQTTAISMTLALKAGVTASELATDRFAVARGAGPAAVRVRLHRFRSLQIGPWVARDPVLPILSLPPSIGAGLVGEDFLLHRRVWLSFGSSQVFVAVPPATAALPAPPRS